MAMIASLAQDTISLMGSWDFATGDSATYNDYVMLPGSMKTNGKDSAYVGKAWYKKDVYIPQSWENQHISLFLERPHTESTIFVNGVKAGHQTSPSTSHSYNVTPCIKPGRRNTIEVCVENQDCWNGIIGKLELRSQPGDLYIKQVKMNTTPFKGIVQVDVELGGIINYFSDNVMTVLVKREDKDSAEVVENYFDVTSNHMVVHTWIGNEIALWSEFYPHLYRMGIFVGNDYYETTFGMREITVDEGMLITNQRPFFLRGAMENGCFTGTDYPPTDEASWTRIFKKLKEYGMNYMRCKGYCPPDAAFEAADKIGIYLQPDGPDLQTIADTYSRHPSLMMLPDSLLHTQLLEVKETAEGQVIPSYKQVIEQHLRDDNYSGFLLPLNDNCEHVGILDAQWREKGYAKAAEWTEFCNPVVALAKFSQPTYTTADTLEVAVEAYNAMYGDIDTVRTTYYINDDSLQVVTGGQLSSKVIPLGKHTDLGVIRFPLDNVKRTGKLTLTVQIAGKIKNHWDFWVYPKQETTNQKNTNVYEEEFTTAAGRHDDQSRISTDKAGVDSR